jgi:hypothetical protein
MFVVCVLLGVGEIRFSVISQCVTFFISHFYVSTWRLKCTKHMGHNTGVVE